MRVDTSGDCTVGRVLLNSAGMQPKRYMEKSGARLVSSLLALAHDARQDFRLSKVNVSAPELSRGRDSAELAAYAVWCERPVSRTRQGHETTTCTACVSLPALSPAAVVTWGTFK